MEWRRIKAPWVPNVCVTLSRRKSPLVLHLFPNAWFSTIPRCAQGFFRRGWCNLEEIGECPHFGVIGLCRDQSWHLETLSCEVSVSHSVSDLGKKLSCSGCWCHLDSQHWNRVHLFLFFFIYWPFFMTIINVASTCLTEDKHTIVSKCVANIWLWAWSLTLQSRHSLTPPTADLQNWKHFVTHFYERTTSRKDCLNHFSQVREHTVYPTVFQMFWYI